MNEDFGKPVSRWWIRGAKTARHRYYTPTTNLQGVLLFALIGLFGGVALFVGVRHCVMHRELARQDVVLSAIGFGCLLLGGVQVWKLARDATGW